MKQKVISIIKDGIETIEKAKSEYPMMRTKDVLSAMKRLIERIDELKDTECPETE